MTVSHRSFYRPENSEYSIVASALDSIRFVIAASRQDEGGNLYCPSVDAAVDATPVRYRGRLMEGVGYCADTIFGSRCLVRIGTLLNAPSLVRAGFSYLDHALRYGFFEPDGAPIRLYRDVETGEMLDNLEARDGYVEPGHIARVATELLELARSDPDSERASLCREIAKRTADWIARVERCPNGWYPRRCTPSGLVVDYAPDAFGPTDLWRLGRVDPPDPVYDVSGSGSFAVQLLARATREGLADYSSTVATDCESILSHRGFFASTNTDTESRTENVSYAIQFQALLDAADLLGEGALEEFAFESCLEPLERFEIRTNISGLQTKGLLIMEPEWNSACTWEMAEAAQAYLRAFSRVGESRYALKSLTILRSVALHHHGEHGFLTEAVDWDGHSARERHFSGETVGSIATTHPFLNNLHIVNPAATYLEDHALGVDGDQGRLYFDHEGNCIWNAGQPRVLQALEALVAERML